MSAMDIILFLCLSIYKCCIYEKSIIWVSRSICYVYVEVVVFVNGLFIIIII